jgi:hypothetical protein
MKETNLNESQLKDYDPDRILKRYSSDGTCQHYILEGPDDEDYIVDFVDWFRQQGEE